MPFSKLFSEEEREDGGRDRFLQKSPLAEGCSQRISPPHFSVFRKCKVLTSSGRRRLQFFCRLLCSRYFRAMVGRLLSPLLLADLIRWKQKFLPPPLGCFRINNSSAAVHSGLCGTSNVPGKEAPRGAVETVIKVPSQGCILRVGRYQNSSPPTPKFHRICQDKKYNRCTLRCESEAMITHLRPLFLSNKR